MAERDETGPDAVVMVRCEPARVSELLAILRDLEIPVEFLHAGTSASDTADVALRLPPHRVVEAVLALTDHGFADARAYEASRQADPDGASPP